MQSGARRAQLSRGYSWHMRCNSPSTTAHNNQHEETAMDTTMNFAFATIDHDSLAQVSGGDGPLISRENYAGAGRQVGQYGGAAAGAAAGAATVPGTGPGAAAAAGFGGAAGYNLGGWLGEKVGGGLYDAGSAIGDRVGRWLYPSK